MSEGKQIPRESQERNHSTLFQDLFVILQDHNDCRFKMSWRDVLSAQSHCDFQRGQRRHRAEIKFECNVIIASQPRGK